MGEDATTDEDRHRFQSVIELLKKYGGRYEFDWLLMAAQGYQESGLDQSKRSHVGADRRDAGDARRPRATRRSASPTSR